MSAVVHPRVAPRRARARAATWWGKAWVRAVEESAYAERDLLTARSLSRSGRIGKLTVDDGRVLAAIDADHTHWTVTAALPVLDAASVDALVEAVAAESGRVVALLAGDLPHALVEHAEQAGVELLPYGGELETSCDCDAWVDPCVHALAVLYQLTWLLEDDPFVLLHLRGLARDDLLARLHARTDETDETGASAAHGSLGPDVETGLDAALRAARVLALVSDPADPDRPVDHLF